MAQKLTFDSGIQSFDINDKCTVEFNPTDLNVAERMYNAFSMLADKQDEFETARGEKMSAKEFFEFSHKRDTEMREILDGLFNTPISEPLFGGMNVYAMSGGIPVWCNLMFALLDVLSDSVKSEAARTNDRLDKYTQKYRRK